MTGFGKAIALNPTRKITIEVKSLNSKQIDVSTRIPACCRELELDIRARVAAVLGRGKVDLNITVENTGTAAGMSLDTDVMAAYKAQIENMRNTLGLPEPTDWYSLLLRFPDTMKNINEQDSTIDSDTIMKTLDKALDELTAFRRREGSKLETFFAERIDAIANLLARIDPFEAERVVKIRHRIEENLANNLRNIDIDKSRLEQEMIFYIEKLDVTEEKQRLNAHLSYFMDTLSAAPGQGKKLGFISQEMGREINTLGSKSNHAEMQRIVVKMKDELEQIKEQVLNVL